MCHPVCHVTPIFVVIFLVSLKRLVAFSNYQVILFLFPRFTTFLSEDSAVSPDAKFTEYYIFFTGSRFVEYYTFLKRILL